MILAVCVKESDAGRLTRGIFTLRKTHLFRMPLTEAEREGKAAVLLDRRSLLKVVAKREYIESLFEFLRDFELWTFAIVMERSTKTPYRGPDFLQTQHQRLLERIERFLERDHPTHFAVPIFDGQDPSSNRMFSDCFTGFMAKTEKGRAMKQIVPSPLFVDSTLTPGIQIADLFAYVTRLNYENALYQRQTVGDPYLSAIKRYAALVRQKTVNYEGGEGFPWYGISTMDASKFYYAAPPEPHREESAGRPVPEEQAKIEPSDPGTGT